MRFKWFQAIVIALLSAPAAMTAPAENRGTTVDALLKPPLLEDRRKAVIQSVVRSTYPELFTTSAAPGWVALTLLLNQDGSLFKGYKDEIQAQPYITKTQKAFGAMGAGIEKYGEIVQLDIRGGSAGSTRIYVRTYFPVFDAYQGPGLAAASAGEPAAKRSQPSQEGPAAPNDDPAVNRAIAEKYFPNLYTYSTPNNEADADFWVLLDRKGKVQATGRRYSGSEGDMKRYLESLYPGIRTDGFQTTELRSDHGRPGVVIFIWLAADSPVTDLSKVDLSKRANLALYAKIGEGGGSETNLIVLKFGTPGVVVCDTKSLDLRVTAYDGGVDSVLLRAQIQRVARLPPAEFEFEKPNAVETDWPPESPSIRVRYGKSAQVRLLDQDGHDWKVELYPDRMQGATSPAFE